MYSASISKLLKNSTLDSFDQEYEAIGYFSTEKNKNNPISMNRSLAFISYNDQQSFQNYKKRGNPIFSIF